MTREYPNNGTWTNPVVLQDVAIDLPAQAWPINTYLLPGINLKFGDINIDLPDMPEFPNWPGIGPLPELPLPDTNWTVTPGGSGGSNNTTAPGQITKNPWSLDPMLIPIVLLPPSDTGVRFPDQSGNPTEWENPRSMYQWPITDPAKTDPVTTQPDGTIIPWPWYGDDDIQPPPPPPPPPPPTPHGTCYDAVTLVCIGTSSTLLPSGNTGEYAFANMTPDSNANLLHACIPVTWAGEDYLEITSSDPQYPTGTPCWAGGDTQPPSTVEYSPTTTYVSSDCLLDTGDSWSTTSWATAYSPNYMACGYNGNEDWESIVGVDNRMSASALEGAVFHYQTIAGGDACTDSPDPYDTCCLYEIKCWAVVQMVTPHSENRLIGVGRLTEDSCSD